MMPQLEEAEFVRQLSDLNRRISSFEAHQPTIRQQFSDANRATAVAGRSHSYRRLQQMIRRPALTYELWPLGVMIAGPLLSGFVAFGLALTLTDSASAGFDWFLVAAACAAPIFAILLYVPNASQLEMFALESERRLRDAQARADELKVLLSNIDHDLQVDVKARDVILQSVQYRRELLLQQNWKDMRGQEWEQFLVRVFQLLGGKVERTGRTGDQGVDLILEIGERRYAIQAKGYFNAVGNAAVQEAVAGIAHYRCNCSAVITNSQFTRGAEELAKSNCCLLIGEDDIPALVLGRLSF